MPDETTAPQMQPYEPRRQVNEGPNGAPQHAYQPQHPAQPTYPQQQYPAQPTYPQQLNGHQPPQQSAPPPYQHTPPAPMHPPTPTPAGYAQSPYTATPPPAPVQPATPPPAPAATPSPAPPATQPRQSFWARITQLFSRGPKTSPTRSYGPPVSPDQLTATLDAPLSGHRISVSSLKGGVGKTTTVLGLGTALAIHRRDTVTALDANPHRGTLSERLGEEHPLTVRNLLDHLEEIRSVSDFRRFTSQNRARFEVIASEKDPERQKGFTAEEYKTVLQVMLTFRSMMITDTGIDLTLDLMNAVYEQTDTLVVATTTAEDSCKLASETLDWWATHAPDGERIIANAVVVAARVKSFALPPDLSIVPNSKELRQRILDFELRQQQIEDDIRQTLGRRVRSVVTVPHDPLLTDGSTFVWERLQPATQQAYLNVAYEVAQGFNTNRR